MNLYKSHVKLLLKSEFDGSIYMCRLINRLIVWLYVPLIEPSGRRQQRGWRARWRWGQKIPPSQYGRSIALPWLWMGQSYGHRWTLRSWWARGRRRWRFAPQLGSRWDPVGQGWWAAPALSILSLSPQSWPTQIPTLPAQSQLNKIIHQPH